MNPLLTCSLLAGCLALTDGRRYDVDVRGVWNVIGNFVFDTVDGDMGEKGLPPMGMMWIDPEQSALVENYTLAVYSDEFFSWQTVAGDIYFWNTDIVRCKVNTYLGRVVVVRDPSGEASVEYPTDVSGLASKGMLGRGQQEELVNPTSLQPFRSLVQPLRPNCTRTPCEGYPSNPFTFPCHQKLSPRTWYFVVSNCNGTNDAEVTVHLHLINKGGWWEREFSLHEQGILELYVVVVPLVALLATVFVGLLVWDWRRGSDSVPAVTKWFLVAVALFLAGWVQKLFAYVSVASDGYGEADGYGTDAVARVMLLQLVCNFSTGFRVLGESFRGLSPSGDSKLIVVGGVVLLVLYIWMYISDPQLSDDRLRSNDNVYQTGPAIAAGCLTLPIACYFCRNVWLHGSAHSEARTFFLGWGGVLLAYISSLPVGLIVADQTSVTRRRDVECSVLVSDVFGCVVCGLLLRPRAWLSRVLRMEFTAPEEELADCMLTLSESELSDTSPTPTTIPTVIPASGLASSDLLLTPMCRILSGVSGSHLSSGLKEDNADEVEL